MFVIMQNLNKPLSVRVSEKDIAFLSAYDADGAVTPSEKVRALIAEARRRAEMPANSEAARQISETVLGPALRHIREAEKATNQHSELLASELAWFEELLSRLLMLPSTFNGDDNDSLKQAESLVTARVVELVDRTLRYALTEKAPAYDPHVLARKIGTIEEILEIFALKQRKRK